MFVRDEYQAITICDENCKLVAEAIKEGRPFYWDLNMPCHTRYELLFTPQSNCVGDHWSGCDFEYVFVSVERRGAYPFNLKHELVWTYIAEKLNIGRPEAEDISKVFAMIGKHL